MKYKELTVLTTTEGSDLVSMILSDAGSEGVTIYDSSDIKELYRKEIIWDYIDDSVLEQSEVVSVKGFYPEDIYDNIYIAVISELEILRENSPFKLGSLETSTIDIDDEDWVNVWRKYYKPIHINNIVIVPKWLKYEAEVGENIVYLDPGMAFGTGEHESTRLCLTLFSELQVKGKRVLDIGTGSGVLGITASVCGAEHVYMSDIDSIAVNAAKQNAQLNKLGSFDIECDDLVSNLTTTGDIVFANITADILIMLSKQIGKLVNKGGVMILSGIIKVRYDEVLSAYISAGFIVDKSMVLGEWCALRLKLK